MAPDPGPHTDPDPSAAVVKGKSRNDLSIVYAGSLVPVPRVRTGGLTVVLRSEPHHTVALSGELDLSGVTQLQDAFSELDPAQHQLTIDMSGLEFIDLAGLVAVSESVANLLAVGRSVDVVLSDAVSWLLETLDSAGCPVALVGHVSQPPAFPG